MISKFMCKAPWTSIAFQPTGVAPCCAYKLEYVEQYSADQSLFESLRENFLQGIIPKGCSDCLKKTETGIVPYYQSFDRYQTDFKTLRIQEINLKSNNFCNLACRSCGPHFSSKWEEEFAGKRIVITKDTNVYEKIATLDLKQLKFIVFAGGEPTIMPEHVMLLQHLIEAKHTSVEIRVATNLQTLSFKNNNLLALWKQFPNLMLNVSIDAVEEHAANIRSGTQWPTMVKNIKQLESCKIQFAFNITVSALNIWFLEHTLDYLHKHFPKVLCNLNLLTEPDILNVNVVPEKFRRQLNVMLDNCLQKNYRVEEVKKQLSENDESHLWQSFLVYNLMLDINRNETLCKNLPIWNDLLVEHIKLS